MKKFKKIFSILLTTCMVFSMGTIAFAAEPDANKAPQPVIIGEYDGMLRDCWNSNAPMPASVANVRVKSYATYDSDNGIQVNVKLYVPALEFPKPEFTAMSGTVSVNLNGSITNTSFFETAGGDSTIETDVDTGVTGNSKDKGTISVSGVATANNALAGGGAFAISYPITIP